MRVRPGHGKAGKDEVLNKVGCQLRCGRRVGLNSILHVIGWKGDEVCGFIVSELDGPCSALFEIQRFIHFFVLLLSFIRFVCALLTV